MDESVFFKLEFFLLLFFSLILPIGLYIYMMRKRVISKTKVIIFSISLILIAAVNVLYLKRLESMSKISPSLVDDQVFASEITIALYIFPAVFAGLGINMVSHILISHLSEAEKRLNSES